MKYFDMLKHWEFNLTGKNEIEKKNLYFRNGNC